MPKITDYTKLEEALGYEFKNKNLLITALTHPSHTMEQKRIGEHYQRLEFLGDAVLSMVLAEKLFYLFPEADEGLLAKYRSVLIRGSFLAILAKKLHLHKYVRLSTQEKKAKGHLKSSILEDALEAVMGAIYLDSDLEKFRQFIEKNYVNMPKILKKLIITENPKGNLQETVHQLFPESNLEYHVIEELGPAHKKEFKVAVTLESHELGAGKGKSKKGAEEEAAMKALDYLKKNPKLTF